MEVKKGDVITVTHDEDVKEYKESGNIEVVMIETGNRPDGVRDMEALSQLKISKIIKNDAHPDLAKFGVNIGHFSIQQIKVESLAFPNKGEVRINGEFDIPFKDAKRVPLLDAFFFDENEAISLANTLNKMESEKFAELEECVKRGRVMLDTIVKKGYV